MTSWASPAITLDPTGNLQGTYKFFILKTGMLLKRQAFALLPMLYSIIRQVEAWNHQSMKPENKLIFAELNQASFLWNDSINHNLLVESDHLAFPVMPAECQE